MAAGPLGRNLSSALAPTAQDDQRYGIAGAQNNIVEIGRTLITAVKAFKLGLTSAVILPAMRDDPHGAFNSGLLTKKVDYEDEYRLPFRPLKLEPDAMYVSLSARVPRRAQVYCHAVHNGAAVAARHR